ncbi:Hypothetical_protein [Hexamita inflata]|uniref:Hypothetical_protein n=1 Tax=Hexamita inflata TaxID=28002 RepID=A0AA86PS06_9EUKA|nr:Hypothetical protein HINF_LOCUS32301 [Hexamita inflata]
MKSKIVNSIPKTQSIPQTVQPQPNNSFEEEQEDQFVEEEIMEQEQIDPIDSIPKFLTKVKIVQSLCSLPFASVRIFLNTKEAYQTQYGYNIRVLMILFTDVNMKPVKKIEPIDSTFSLKFKPKIQYVYVDIESKQQKSKDGNLFYPQSLVFSIKPEIIKKLKLDEYKQKESKRKVNKEIDYDLVEQM